VNFVDCGEILEISMDRQPVSWMKENEKEK
jgi:hypothetical protein